MGRIREKRQWILLLAGLVLLAVLLVLFAVRAQLQRRSQSKSSTTFCMSTVVDQRAYGANAEEAMQKVEQALRDFEDELSLYRAQSDIAQINAAAGGQPVAVQPQTLALLQQGKELALQSENAFALTLAPLTLAWGITSETPHVPPQSEIDALLPFVNDNDILLDAKNGTVQLVKQGQAIDLGGIAKGTACNVARAIYTENGVDSALLSIGGNIYAHGAKPDGSEFRIGFRDPSKSAGVSIASFTLRDATCAVSGGYERYFEENGVRYHHILDPETGAPAESDIVSVGVVDADGTVADFYSTTLFVWGKEKALAYLSGEGTGLLLDAENNLYVSRALQASFELVEDDYNVVFL